MKLQQVSDPKMIMPTTVRKDDVTRMSGLSRSTIERMMKAGTLRFKKVGRCVLIDHASVMELLAS